MTINISTEDKIIDAAKKVFLQQGYSGARMQDIADAAGINKALLHYYFRNKDKLFELIFLQCTQKMIPTINSVFDSDEDIFNKIRQFVSTYIEML
ncbi:MAG TPA: helix-turn-helix domain-containing protein, partial [Saprospiraceae bacterium]|nr:helix-turn-helix domain-containing protein [Saprospiraceae bacterium]